MFVDLVDTSSSKVQACYRIGPAFTAADIMGTTNIDLQDSATYQAVHLPLTLPIPFGINDTTKGTISESSIDILDTMAENGTFWDRCILAYDKAHSDELVCCIAEGIGKLGNHLILPRLLPGQSWGSPTTCKVSTVGNSKEGEAKLATNALALRLAEITDLAAHGIATPATVTASPGGLEGLVDNIATTAPSILCKENPAGGDLPTKDVPLNE